MVPNLRLLTSPLIESYTVKRSFHVAKKHIDVSSESSEFSGLNALARRSLKLGYVLKHSRLLCELLRHLP
jgi:hypothetical protein